jgi:prefoldin subunit 5
MSSDHLFRLNESIIDGTIPKDLENIANTAQQHLAHTVRQERTMMDTERTLVDMRSSLTELDERLTVVANSLVDNELVDALNALADEQVALDVASLATSYDAVITALAVVQGDVATLLPLITTVDGIASQLDSLTVTVGTLSNDVTNLLATFNAHVLAYDSFVLATDASLLDHDGRISILESTVAATLLSITSIESEIVSIQQTIGGIETDYQAVVSDIASLDLSVQNVSNRVTDLETIDAGARLTLVENDLSGALSQIAFLQAAVTANASAIVSLGGDIAVIQADPALDLDATVQLTYSGGTPAITGGTIVDFRTLELPLLEGGTTLPFNKVTATPASDWGATTWSAIAIAAPDTELHRLRLRLFPTTNMSFEYNGATWVAQNATPEFLMTSTMTATASSIVWTITTPFASCVFYNATAKVTNNFSNISSHVFTPATQVVVVTMSMVDEKGVSTYTPVTGDRANLSVNFSGEIAWDSAVSNTLLNGQTFKISS